MKPIENAAIIYARYSSHNQRDVSIDQQIKECKKYAERLGLVVVDIYADRALTGTSDKRPEFQRMIRDAEKGAFVYVIVYTLDRFARDRYDSAVYKRQLRNCGVKVLSAMENISDDPTGVLMESMLEGLAEYYSKELSRKIKRGMEDNAEKCMVNGALGLGHRRGADGRYEIDEAGAAIVKESFARVAAGEPFVQIFEDYNRRGLRTKTGKEWNRSSFNKMLTNERYRGVYIYGDTRIEGGIPRIIEDDLFYRVQEKLQTKPRARNNPQKRRRENGIYLLTGKLFCGNCKSPMVGISGKSTDKTVHYYYTCKKRRVEKTCDKAMARRDWAELQIATAIKTYILNDDVINWLADCAIEYMSKLQESPDVVILKSRLSETRKAIKNIVSAIEQGIFTTSTKARLSELENEEAELAAKLSLMQEKQKLPITREHIVAWLLMFREGDLEDKTYQEQLIDAFLIAAYLYDDHWKIVVKYTADKSEITLPFDMSDFDSAPESISDCLYNVPSPPPAARCRVQQSPAIILIAGLFSLFISINSLL